MRASSSRRPPPGGRRRFAARGSPRSRRDAGCGCPPAWGRTGDPVPHGRMARMPLKFTRQRARDPETPGVRGLVRVDTRTKNLTKRLKPGEIAVIDHQDIDKVSAEALLACRPAAVVNASPSISGRYPHLGPELL